MSLLLEVLVETISLYLVRRSAVVAYSIPGHVLILCLSGVCQFIFRDHGSWSGCFSFRSQCPEFHLLRSWDVGCRRSDYPVMLVRGLEFRLFRLWGVDCHRSDYLSE